MKELEEKGELEDGDPLNGFFKKIFAQVGLGVVEGGGGVAVSGHLGLCAVPVESPKAGSRLTMADGMSVYVCLCMCLS